MAQIKQTKEYKRKRIESAKQLIRENFGQEAFGILKKKYASYSGKGDKQAEIYKLLFDEGFSYREIAKITKKAHETIRHAILTSANTKKITYPASPSVSHPSQEGTKPKISFATVGSSLHSKPENPVIAEEKGPRPNLEPTEDNEEEAGSLEDQLEQFAKSVYNIDKTLYGSVFPTLHKAKEYIAVDEEEEETIEDDRISKYQSLTTKGGISRN